MAWDWLRNLLSRRWFHRVWTWQEKGLAKKATVYIGDRTLPWADLRFAMLLVMAHNLSKTRATSMIVMPSREYLHVIDSLGIDKSPDLLDIVVNVRHRETEVPRDKIFGVLGIAACYGNMPSTDVTYFTRLVNYGYLKTQDLYREFSRYWIVEKHDLRVLQAFSPSKRKMSELPSWVVDWSDTTPSHQLSSRIYTASKGKDEVGVKHHYHLNNNELQLTGVPIDTLELVCHDTSVDKAERHLGDRTVDQDHWRARLVQPLISLLLPKTYRERKDVEVSTQRWIEALDLSLLYKHFFVTEKGLIGLAPNNIQVGDLVCVFYGGKVPFALRKKEDYYNLVEETYLHGFMDGKAIGMQSKKQLDEASFCIRLGVLWQAHWGPHFPSNNSQKHLFFIKKAPPSITKSRDPCRMLSRKRLKMSPRTNPWEVRVHENNCGRLVKGILEKKF
ncbi:hypothetical protein K504DRAFT_449137 [Pleomassaria siparia CBS 279.74]|uniref:Heterokaryon incompatibility domain-containing protein n=1 Tax=Pleomassaria siparia CBS 279.74 TaxID=1314801 RepID=A0A6G1JXM5_9PLEO|nr:hypothetical protein K504DRAFT_449137 [Pleomassaria siparia CBS 279.74]